MSRPPASLDHAAIAARVPHHGRMCLLDSALRWDMASIECQVGDHRAADHPLRSRSGLLMCAAIEMAGQAMALHGALCAEAAAPGDAAPPPRPGFLASVRQVAFGEGRLDERPGPLRVWAERLAGDDRQVQYGFHVDDADGRSVALGRAAVFLGPLA